MFSKSRLIFRFFSRLLFELIIIKYLLFFRAYLLCPYSSRDDNANHAPSLLNRAVLGRVFEDEYDLVEGIIEGMNHRGEQGGFEVERFIFN